ncbi:DEAD/DEAH box helicase [Alicyclobacillus ferrooxydans]|uniref:DEAD/DEAH box helicase n=1 Tax=Alicyclobacillus ferrooxydans TaxID=471514 RepID=UPI0006D5374A|nr:DEAD/DEAH box helicase [Alicyclobacillus ferrooxydans]
MPKETLVTRSQIREFCGTNYYSRGKRYYEEGRVLSVRQDETDPAQWTALVRGKRVYEVNLTINEYHLEGDCNCPIFDPWDACKHVAAALMAIGDLTKSGNYSRPDLARSVTEPSSPLTGRSDAAPSDHFAGQSGMVPTDHPSDRPDAAAATIAHDAATAATDTRNDTVQPDPPNFSSSTRLLDLFRRSEAAAALSNDLWAVDLDDTLPTVPASSWPTGNNASSGMSMSANLDRATASALDRNTASALDRNTASAPGRNTAPAPGSTSSTAQSARPLRSATIDSRELLSVEFFCAPHVGGFAASEHIQIEMKIGPQKTYVVKKIRDFLLAVEENRPFYFTPRFSYGPDQYRFRPEDLRVIRVLCEVMHEEALYRSMMGNYSYTYRGNERALFISPIVWRSLHPLLLQSDTTVVGKGGNTVGPIHVTVETPDVNMQIVKHGEGHYGLEVSGLDDMVPLPSYGCVVSGSTFHLMDPVVLRQFVETQKVLESQRMMEADRVLKLERRLGRQRALELLRSEDAHPLDDEEASKTSGFSSETKHTEIPIAEDALQPFMNEVLPGLRRIGQVEVDASIRDRVIEAPLHAKLYLDRYTNQAPYWDEDVLTGRLVFTYEDSIVDPFNRQDADDNEFDDDRFGTVDGLGDNRFGSSNSQLGDDGFGNFTHSDGGQLADAYATESGALIYSGSDTDTRQIIVRDLIKETQIVRFLYQSGFDVVDGELILSGEDYIYEFVYERLPELEQWVEVFATSSVDGWIRPAAVRPKSRIEIDTKTNWLEVSFDIGDLSADEVMHVLQSMIERKKYHRLESGAFVSLQTEGFSELQRVVSELGLKPSDLKKAVKSRKEAAVDDPQRGAAPQSGASQDNAGGTAESGGQTLDLRIPSIRALPLIEGHDGMSHVKFGRALRRWLDNLRNPDNIDVDLPTGLRATLREYQKFGFQWMKTLAQYGFGGILADDMGLGKTIQTIAFLLSEREGTRTGDDPVAGPAQGDLMTGRAGAGKAAAAITSGAPVLIVCPASLTYNWKSEIEKFAPGLHAVIVTGDKAEREAIVAAAGHNHGNEHPDVIITSYPLLWRDIDMYRDVRFSTLILDEAQAIKNHTTQTAQAVGEIQSVHRFALTGTPVENSLDDLWSIFRAVFPDLLGSRKSFSNLPPELVARHVRPFILRRLKRDVLTELPDKIETLQTAELTKEQKAAYMAYLAQLQKETIQGLETQGFQKGRFQILAGLTRLRQICCHPSLCIDNFRGNSGKLDQLLELVEEYRLANQRILIFSQFTSMLAIIQQELQERGFDLFYLDGQTPAKDRLELCDRFNQGAVPIFLISLKAGGTGLNLTGADTVILYDLWWNPAVEEQAADRAHRIGQKNTVQVIRMVTQGTIEEKMYQLQQKKRDLIDSVVQANDEGLSALTEDDIRSILSI